MKNFKAFIQESLIDIPRKRLAPDIFDGDKLKPAVKKFIENGLKTFSDLGEVQDYQLIGSILTNTYRDDADLDINVLFNSNANHKELRKRAAKINGKKFTKTEHPVNYYAIVNKTQFDLASKLADGVFDIKNNKFIRKPKPQKFDANKYLSQFQNEVGKIDLVKGELERDLIDFEELKQLSSKDVDNLYDLLNKKVKEIEESINTLIDIYLDKKDKRLADYSKPLSAKELKDFGAKDALPSNVIYKMLEKFHYFKFIQKLKNIIGDDHKLSKDEAEKLTKLKNEKL
jgi:hypothetical protein